MPKIKLSNGKYTLVSREDYEFLSQYNWRLHVNKNHPKGYVLLSMVRKNETEWRKHHRSRKLTTVYMHKIVEARKLGRPIKRYELVDHKDTNTLNNRRSNVRVTDYTGNARNRKANKNSSSRYKGVSWHKGKNKWVACWKYNKKLYHLGSFVEEEEAARAYDAAARPVFGKFGRYNFPMDGEQEA